MIQVERFDGGTVLRLAHGKASAMDVELLHALSAALDDAERGGARSIVLTGTGDIFSAGVDLIRFLDGAADELDRFLPALSDAFEKLFFTPLPVVAAVNGHAIAGGAIAALASDRRVMARGAGRIGVPELVVGVPFPLVPLEIVRAALTPAVFHEAAMMGTLWDAEGARASGLVDEVVDAPDLMSRAQELARRMAAVAAATFAATKRRARRPVRETLDRLRSEHDADTRAAWSSPAVRDAVRAYVSRTLKR